MMSGEAIRALNRKMTQKANRLHLCPGEAPEDGVLGHCPWLGDHLEPGWAKVGEPMFVDKSGLGRPDEPAMTQDAFLKRVRKGYGYGIVEEGQFQVYVQEYERVGERVRGEFSSAKDANAWRVKQGLPLITDEGEEEEE